MRSDVAWWSRLRSPVIVAFGVAGAVAGGAAVADAGSAGAAVRRPAHVAVQTTALAAVQRSAQGAVHGTAPVVAPTATTVLAQLAVKGRAPKTGYARTKFGDGWADEDHDGCWTREEILQRDLTKKTYRRSGRCMVIVTGVLADPYSGEVMIFRRGTATSGLVQIDHVVALSDAWQTGAQKLSLARRVAFADDPLNLLAVNGKLNFAKGASDAASWLPPNKAYRCRYVARQVAVKHKYGLWVTAAEKVAIARVLATCPGQKVPIG